MKSHPQEYLGALLDGELRGLRRLRVVRHVRTCPLCAVEFRHQRHVRRLLRANPPVIAMSDSPEFFWSKIKQEIDRRGTEVVVAPLPRLRLADWLSRHQAALATAAVVLIAALTFLVTAPQWMREATRQFAAVDDVSTSLPDTAATVIPMDKPGVSVIWVSGLPWTPSLSEIQDVYEHLDI